MDEQRRISVATLEQLTDETMSALKAELEQFELHRLHHEIPVNQEKRIPSRGRIPWRDVPDKSRVYATIKSPVIDVNDPEIKARIRRFLAERFVVVPNPIDPGRSHTVSNARPTDNV